MKGICASLLEGMGEESRDILLENGGTDTKQKRVAESKEGVGERNGANEKNQDCRKTKTPFPLGYTTIYY